MATRGTEDTEDPISQSMASSEDLLPRDDDRERQRRSAGLPTAATAQQQADEEENLDDLLELLQDSDEDETTATSSPTQQHTAPPPKRARRLPGWMASSGPITAAAPAAAHSVHSARAELNAPSGASRSVASRQMERAFEQDQAQKRRKLEDAKASSAASSSTMAAAPPPRLLGALVDPAATASSAATRRGLTLLTRALFPRRVVVFDVETTGFAQDDVIVEIGGIELIDGVRTVRSTPPRHTHHPLCRCLSLSLSLSLCVCARARV